MDICKVSIFECQCGRELMVREELRAGDMEYAVLFIQGDGPLEMFHGMTDPAWASIVNGIKRSVMHYHDYLAKAMASRN